MKHQLVFVLFMVFVSLCLVAVGCSSRLITGTEDDGDGGGEDAAASIDADDEVDEAYDGAGEGEPDAEISRDADRDRELEPEVNGDADDVVDGDVDHDEGTLGPTPCFFPEGTTVVGQDTMETGISEEWRLIVRKNNPVVQVPADEAPDPRNVGFCLKANLDWNAHTSGKDKERCECRWTNLDGDGAAIPELGEDYWFQIDYYLAAPWPGNPDHQSEILMQMHDMGNPAFGFRPRWIDYVDPPRLMWNSSGGWAPDNPGGGNENGAFWEVWDDDPMAGEWFTIVVHFRLDPSGDGQFRLWMVRYDDDGAIEDATRRVDYAGPLSEPQPWEGSGGLKFGLYAPSWDYTEPPAPDPSTRTVYMTNYYMGNGGTGTPSFIE